MKEALQKCIRSRAAYKGKITIVLKKLEKEKDGGTLDECALQRQERIVSNYVSKIESIEEHIVDIYDSYGIEVDNEDRVSETESSMDYLTDVQNQLAAFEKGLKKPKSELNNKDFAQALSDAPPSRNLIKCPYFSGNSADKLEFKFWLSQFETMLSAGRQMSGKYKLSALRNNLTVGGLAHKLIFDLDITNDNYEIALQILKDEFLDIEHIRDQLLDQILNKSPKYDPEYENLRLYIAEVKSVLNDLKTSYNADLFVSGGSLLARKIIFDKISPSIQKSLMEVCKTNYPSLVQIFDNIREVIKTVVMTKGKKVRSQTSQ